MFENTLSSRGRIVYSWMEELSHAKLLNEKGIAIIRKAFAKRVPPHVMRELRAWQHEEITEEMAEVVRLIEMYNKK